MGLCTELDANMSPPAVIRPYLEEFVLGPEKDWSDFVVTTTKDLAMSALALPGEMKKFMARASRGELEVRWRNLDDAAQLVYKLGHQLIYTLIMLTGGVLGFVLDERGHPGKARVAAWIAVGAATLLVGSFISMRGKLKRKRR
jgi:ubiquinone biosynthesis protein